MQGAASIESAHLLLALASDQRLGAALQRQGLDAPSSMSLLQPVGGGGSGRAEWLPRYQREHLHHAPAAIDGPSDQPAQPSADDGALAQYGRDLTGLARDGELDPVIGRDADIRRLIQVLSPQQKQPRIDW